MLTSKEWIGVLFAFVSFMVIVFFPKTYTLEAGEVTIVYAEELPTESFCIIEKKILKKEIPVSNNMFEYDKEFIGTQEAVFRYKDKEVVFKLTILPKQLNSPQISLMNNKITWRSVSGAFGYRIFINDESIDLNTTEFSLKDYNGVAGALNIRVKAVTKSEKYLDSEFSNTLELKKLTAVKDIYYQDGNLSWKTIEGADYYEIYVNNTEYITRENRYPVTDFVAGVNSVKVVALSDEPFVVASEGYEEKFPKWQVKNITYKAGTICWESTALPGECRYQVTINGTLYETSSNYLEYSLINDVGYRICVQALPLDMQSVESDIVEQDIIYEKLKKPEASILIGNYKNTYTVKVEKVENADRYKIDLTLYAGNKVTEKNYTIYSLEKNFEVTENISRIVANIVAIDSKGQYMDSDVLTIEKIIR